MIILKKFSKFASHLKNIWIVENTMQVMYIRGFVTILREIN